MTITLLKDTNGTLYAYDSYDANTRTHELLEVEEYKGAYTCTNAPMFVDDKELAEMTEICVTVGDCNEHKCNETWNDSEWTRYWGVDEDEYEEDDYANEGED